MQTLVIFSLRTAHVLFFSSPGLANQQCSPAPDVQSQVMCLNPPLMSHEARLAVRSSPRVIGPGSFRHAFMGNALLESG